MQIASYSQRRKEARIPELETVRLGVVGCGGHALDAHVAPLMGTGASCEAVFDPDEQALGRAQKILKSPFRCMASLDDLLQADLHAVLIASPDKYHLGALTKAVAAGKHVLVEKPLATSEVEVAALRKVLAEAQQKGLIVSSCHPRRFDPPFVWLKSRLSSWATAWGRPLRFEFDFSYHHPERSWKTCRSLLLDHANHEIDLLHFLFGYAACSARKIEDACDRYEVTGKRADGLSFNFSGSRLLEERVFREMLTIRYARATVTLYPDLGLTTLFEHASARLEKFSCPPTDYSARGHAVTENFMAALHGTAPCYLTARDLLLNTTFCVSLCEHGSWNSDEALLA